MRPHESVFKFRRVLKVLRVGERRRKQCNIASLGEGRRACAIIETQEVKFRVGVDRSKGIAQDFNRRYDVESLCRGFPKRVQLLVEGKGKKLRT